MRATIPRGVDEQVLHETRPHVRRLVAPVFWTIVVWGGAGLVYGFADNDPDARAPVLAGATLAWAVLSGRTLLRWRSTSYVLTTHRLILRSGVLLRRVRDLPLSSVTSMDVTRSLLDRLTGAGDVVVRTAGEPVVLADVPAPDRLRAFIHDAAGRRASGGPVSLADEISKLASLRDRGLLSSREFESHKQRLLGA